MKMRALLYSDGVLEINYVVSTASAPPCAPALPRREARICEKRAVMNLNLPRFR